VLKSAEQSSHPLTLIIYAIEASRMRIEEAKLMYKQVKSSAVIGFNAFCHCFCGVNNVLSGTLMYCATIRLAANLCPNGILIQSDLRRCCDRVVCLWDTAASTCDADEFPVVYQMVFFQVLSKTEDAIMVIAVILQRMRSADDALRVLKHFIGACLCCYVCVWCLDC
jgi:hypothetical protein